MNDEKNKSHLPTLLKKRNGKLGTNFHSLKDPKLNIDMPGTSYAGLHINILQ